VDQSAATDRAGDESGLQMPSVADYWPSPPTGVLPKPRDGEGPPHAADDPPDVEPPAGDDGITWISPPETRHGGVRLTLGGVIALILLLVIGGVLTAVIRQAHSHLNSSAASPQTASPAPAPTGGATIAPVPVASPSTAQAAAGALPPVGSPAGAGTTRVPSLPAAATFEMAATDSSVTVVSRNLGADLYRVTLATSDAPVRAVVSDTSANHRLTLVKDSDAPAPAATIALNSAVRWGLKLSGGNTQTAANLAGARLAALELAGGAHVFTLTLPPAAGTLPLRITHGMNQLTINTNGVPVRLTLRTGAGKVILDGETHTDTKPGRVLASETWPTAANRVDVDSVEGVGTLIVNTH
jgi:hypothetical protein